MKTLKLTGIAILSGLLATTSSAGTLTEADIIEVDEAELGSSASSGSSGAWLPILALVLVAALVASDDSDGPASNGGGGDTAR